MFLLNGDLGGGTPLDAVDEDRRPESKRLKESKESSTPTPFLPDLNALGGGKLSGDGDLHWDEKAFQRQ
jgi:hypothetical protein